MSDSNQPSGQQPKLHIDSDWKAQAQAEKERLAKAEAERSKSRRDAPESDEMPPADFKSLVGVLASQALMGLGAYADPQGRVVVDLVGSRFSIDLLGILEEKTRGNLDPDEAKDLQTVLGELRSRFIQIASMVAQQMKAQGGIPTASMDEGSHGIAGRLDPRGVMPPSGPGPTGGPGKPILEVP